MQGIVKRQTLQDISDAIQFAKGVSSAYTPTEMANAISTLNIYENHVAELLSHDIRSIDNSTVTKIRDYAFYNCTLLNTVNFPNVNHVGVSSFNGCTHLTTITLPKIWEVGADAFRNCSALTTVDLGDGTLYDGELTLGGDAFNGCTALVTFIIRETQMAAVTNSTYFAGTPIANRNGYIYVPSKLVSTYKRNNYWSTYTDQFRAIEDYPDICG